MITSNLQVSNGGRRAK